MAHIRFDPEPVGPVNNVHNAYVSSAKAQCAFIPFMVFGTGVEALVQGLRLANIDRSVEPGSVLLDELSHDVNTGDRKKLGAAKRPQLKGVTLSAKAVPKD